MTSTTLTTLPTAQIRTMVTDILAFEKQIAEINEAKSSVSVRGVLESDESVVIQSPLG